MKEKLGFVLGGGGARGLAHLGAIDALTENGIIPDLVVGTSIGALLGALYATTGDCKKAMQRIDEYFACDCYAKIQFDFVKEAEEGRKHDGLLDSLSRYFRKKLFYNYFLANQQSFVSLETYMENINFLIDDIDIQETKIPFAAVCTDINTGEETVLTKGPLRQAVAASSAIPGIFPPIPLNSHLLMDGGWVNQLPVDTCSSLGADYVIAVNVGKELEQDFSTETALDIIRRTNAITRTVLNEMQARAADAIIEPEVGDISWAQFGCIEDCMRRGRVAAEEFIEVYKENSKSDMPSFFKKLFT
ncbi:MAG: patatin-like phospholipase family protein [Proteobacteria bacterium]|nr:patatin-like phospholipase family protein [Pseudomonadota bacterium]MBU1738158.1 patatin-like phospholipase family protein [Pseudomonadota bacterium]